jgi:hypothetical protein
VDPKEVLRLYDREMRANPPYGPETPVERTDQWVLEGGDEETIVFYRLTDADVPGAVRAMKARVDRTGRPLEWKVYAHDAPPTLVDHLRAAGFVADPDETLVVCDLQRWAPPPPSTGPLVVRAVRSDDDLEAAVRVSRAAFDGWSAPSEAHLRESFRLPTVTLYLALWNGMPIATGRLELPTGRPFASLWGGGTVPEARQRGAYRTLVTHRLEVAHDAGYSFATVDARETSRPILERLGFVPLTRIQGWVLTPAKGASPA